MFWTVGRAGLEGGVCVCVHRGEGVPELVCVCVCVCVHRGEGAPESGGLQSLPTLGTVPCSPAVCTTPARPRVLEGGIQN